MNYSMYLLQLYENCVKNLQTSVKYGDRKFIILLTYIFVEAFFNYSEMLINILFCYKKVLQKIDCMHLYDKNKQSTSPEHFLEHLAILDDFTICLSVHFIRSQ